MRQPFLYRRTTVSADPVKLFFDTDKPEVVGQPLPFRLVVAVRVACFAPIIHKTRYCLRYGRVFAGLSFLRGLRFVKYPKLYAGVAAKVARGTPLLFAALLGLIGLVVQLGRQLCIAPLRKKMQYVLLRAVLIAIATLCPFLYPPVKGKALRLFLFAVLAGRLVYLTRQSERGRVKFARSVIGVGAI